jgi:hypothetical protein
MTSPLLALFTRSLREDARAKLTYFARGGFVGFVLLIGLISGGAASMSGWSGAVGLQFFTVLVVLQTTCVTVAGIGFFASAITEEKEEMTLGLLRMTNLNPLSILLGKSTSRLCSVLLLLVAPLPFTVLAVTLGGVSLGQITAAYATLGAYTFFLCNLALLASVVARNTGSAGSYTSLGVLLFFGASSVLRTVFTLLGKLGWVARSASEPVEDALWSITPVARFTEVLTTGFAGGPVGVQVVSNLLLGLGCFLLAWALFGKCCDQALDGVAAGPARRRVLGLRFRRPGRPWKDALAWKEFHFQTGGQPALLLRILVYGILLIIGLFAFTRVDPSDQFAALRIWPMSLVPFLFSLDVAFLASRVFRAELNEQTFASIAALPAALSTLAWRKVRGCLVAALPGAVCLLVLVVPYFMLLLRMEKQDFTLLSLGNQLSGWLNYLFLWLLVAYLSLFLKRGSLPLGYILAQVVTVLFSSLFMVGIMTINFIGRSGNFTSAVTYLMPIGSSLLHLVVCWILLRRIRPRLEVLAGEE